MMEQAVAQRQARILIVDDEPINVKVLVDLLRDQYALVVAKDGPQALSRLAGDVLPDLVLLDVMMPGMDGLEVCRRIKADPRTADLPVIFVTALGQAHDEAHGFTCGAVDYITKPISPPVVLARVATHLTLRRAQAALRDQNRQLEDRVRQRTAEVVMTQDVTIRALASLAETRDNETGNHIRRTQYYVRRLAEELRGHARFAADLDDRTIDLLFKSAPLHDVGKVGIPDAILLKPGRLTDEEFTIMKRHAALGREALLAALDGQADQGVDFLRYAMEIAAGHHEKWDGSGYPAGLAGEAIPLSARLMAVADVYDALISRRVYKPAFPHEKAVAIITEGRGSHFDPDIVDAFLRIADDFRAIAARYADDD
ncbi:two-component system response regulator [Caenispirillum bisanense]|uniref:HD-GYP domain-containing protein n=1 Tax=Caenispirillum bisanense TaxID=414052 RepID=UPI0031D44D66